VTQQHCDIVTLCHCAGLSALTEEHQYRCLTVLMTTDEDKINLERDDLRVRHYEHMMRVGCSLMQVDWSWSRG